MKELRLTAPRVIDGVVRYPTEGLIPVEDDQVAQQLIDDKAAEDPDATVHDDLDGMKVAQLRETAEREGVQLEGDANKATIIQAIRAKRVGAGG
jgi:hypothetical protein